MKKALFSLAICLLFVFYLPANATATQTPNKINPNIAERPAGRFEVFVLKKGQWHQAGALEYDKYLGEKKINLSRFLPDGEAIQIRLIQKGGGAAHIDTVRMGDSRPSEINGSAESFAINKVSKRDFDILDGFQKTLEFIFKPNTTEKILKLTARIEPKNISKTPFQFPPGNLFIRNSKNSRTFC